MKEGAKGKFSDKEAIADTQARGIIISALSEDLQAIVNDKTAFEAVTALNELFAVKNTAKLVNDLMLLLNHKMAKDDTNSRHFTSHWQILRNNVDTKDLSINDVFKLVYLASLNSRYQPIAVEFGHKKLSEFKIEDVKSKVFNNSDMILAASGEMTMVAAAAVMTMASSQSVDFCVYCKKKGHVVDDCRKLKAKNDKSDKPARSEKSGKSDEIKVMKFKLAGTSIYAAHASVNWLTRKDTWLLDLGANASSCHEHSAFVSHRPEGGCVTTVSGGTISICGRGTIALGNDIEIDNVLHIPNSAINLLSVSRLAASGCSVLFDADRAFIYKDGVVILAIEANNGLYPLTVTSGNNAVLLEQAPMIGNHMSMAASCGDVDMAEDSSGKYNAVVSQPPLSANVACHLIEMSASQAHQLFGHCSPRYIKAFAEKAGIKLVGDFPSNCPTCTKAKPVSSPFKGKLVTNSSKPLEVVHSDVGVLSIPSFDGHKYYVMFTDEFSCLSVTTPMKQKSDVPRLFEEYVALMERQLDFPVKCLHSDNGGEFINTKIKSFCASRGIIHTTSTPHTPQQNGIAECINRTLIESTVANEKKAR